MAGTVRPYGDGALAPPERQLEPPADASLTDLLRRLASDTGELLRGEVNLAKLELRDTAKQTMLDALKIGGALGVAWLGIMALVAAAVLGLGTLLGGMYWLAAIIVGVLLIGVGALLAKRGLDGLKAQSYVPETAVQSIRHDAEFAKDELRELRQGLKS